jgi:hypothetical protein
MRTIDDLRRELDKTANRAFAHLTPFKVPALTPTQRLKIDEMDPDYLRALDHCRCEEIPLSRKGAELLLLRLAAAGATTNDHATPVWGNSVVTHPQYVREQAERTAEMRAALDGAVTSVMGQREEILRAFIAKYGFQPDEAEQVEQDTPTGRRWYVRRRGACA